ncbi:MAG: hypothetical protein FJ143_08930 [Deltaproteobacteria bacterium]|nr:hypothetical protein [Deltaproteobacteria bacterium]MBM4297850.1 hypothetical protein [Deltaproteobacteria bacterium]
MALVYFYRPRGESFGYDRTYFLGVNGQIVTDLLHGGYFPYETALRSLSLVSDLNRSVRTYVAGTLFALPTTPEAARLEFQLEAGKTYYVRMRPQAGALNFTPHLTLVPKEVAEKEIADCKLLASRM